MTMQRVEIHTDGACSGNPGPGGWGAILRYGDVEKELNGGEPVTTNNRMELMAAIAALESLKRPCVVDMHTDSQYLRNGVTQWIHGWKRNGWRTADKRPVKNEDLWKRLDAAGSLHQVQWHWVKGHAGHDLNERADQLARDAIKAMRSAARVVKEAPGKTNGVTASAQASSAAIARSAPQPASQIREASPSPPTRRGEAGRKRREGGNKG